ncbi:MAG TPA: hypothetical protein VF599_17390 [Pyrinomonadaceae bacterium]|jgi:hypothetical protein
MSSKPKSYRVAPNSVYVWRGFMAPPPRSYAQFTDFLGSVFVPACALLQPKVGLRAYLPTMVPQKNKPAAVPDQTALMFWATPEAHDLANGAIAVRIYQNLHGDAYDMNRSHLPEVPLALPETAAQLIAEQPYFLFDNPADWMLGQTSHVVGGRPENVSPADFLASVYKWAADFKTNAPKNIDAALVCGGNDYAVAWAHSAAKTDGNFSKCLDGFAALTRVQMQVSPRPLTLGAGLWNKWSGIDLTKPENASINIQLTRPAKTIPVS